MNLNQLQYVLSVAEHRSFSLAAESLFISQSTLSQQIMNLESELGVKLFLRTTRDVQITEAGRAFLEEAAEILRRTNEVMCKNNNEEMFVTVWIGILELSTGRLKAANAGHEYPVLRRPGGAFELVKDAHGFILGGMEGLQYSEYEIMLEPGAELFLYTDGITEATSAEKELFGTERLLDALNSTIKEEKAAAAETAGTGREKPAAAEVAENTEEILAAVRSAIGDFVKDAPQFDDMTMMCLKYEGPDRKS